MLQNFRKVVVCDGNSINKRVLQLIELESSPIELGSSLIEQESSVIQHMHLDELSN